MEPKYRRCCGIDVHKKSVTVCVLPPVGKPEMEVRKRNFRTFRRDLKQLRAWLKNCKVTEIAMESTGQYWRSIWNLLEDREVRDLTRQRVHVLEDMNRVKNRIEQLCQTGNIKVSSVATDLFGVSGRRMLKAVVERQARRGLDGRLCQRQSARQATRVGAGLRGQLYRKPTLAAGQGTASTGMAGESDSSFRAGDRAAIRAIPRSDAALDDHSRD